jgi:hypothetical protein
LERFENLNNISGGAAFDEIQKKLYNSEFSILDEYSVIMLHRSAFETGIRNGIMDYLKKSQKKIIFFSGGISGCQISKIGELEIMLLNVKEFYSDNLVLFLDNGSENILELAFGTIWKISHLIDSYDKLTIYLKNYRDRPWTRVEEDLNLSSWIKENYFKEVQQKSLINKFYLEDVLNNINTDLKEAL